MDYPYQRQFQLFLRQQNKAAITVKNYDASIKQFFTFLTDSRDADLTIDQVNENDVRAYLAILQEQSLITLSTYNKILSQLNTYFTFLFSHQLIHSLPTLTIHGQAIEPNQKINTKWLAKLPIILQDDHLHFYTRATLLLCSYGFTVAEFLQPGFEKVWNQLAPRDQAERTFRQHFQHYLTRLQQLQGSSRIFLKQRYNATNPGLSNAGLHKYLHHDEQYLGFSCAPKYLHQAYIVATIQAHPTASARKLEEELHLDPASFLYYQRLIMKRS